MFIFIPSSTTYTATVSGSVAKGVTCESCGESYTYLLSRTVTGSDSAFFFASRAQENALKKARAKLAKALETEHDDIPCPACRWHQSRNVAHVHGNSYAGMKNLAGAFFIIAGIVLGVMLGILGFTVLGNNPQWPSGSTVLECAVAVLVIAAPGLFLRGLRSLLLLTYRPTS